MKCWTQALAMGVTVVWVIGASSAVAAGPVGTETDCSDGIDNDGDGFTDCADSDCYDAPECQPDGRPENTNERCSDWIDNDGNGHVDCSDIGCYGPGVTVCQGSWDREQQVEGAVPMERPSAPFIDELAPGTRWEDLGPTSMRFSVVSFVTTEYSFTEKDFDTRFKVLQLRAFGPIPAIQDSFFLISMRAERTPRLTFAMFQVPLGGGHYLNINSGGGSLSTALIRSASSQLLIDRPFYLYSAFEQGNGAAAEVSGPVTDDGKINYRVFGAAGSGRFAGNVGGRFFAFDNTNFTWTLGAQLHFNLIGFLTRWDSPMLYNRVPTSLGLSVGAKYDQRAQERYPAWNLNLTLRSHGLIASAETYMKRELEFESWQIAWNLSVGYLLVPRHILIAADIGEFRATTMQNPPEVEETDLRQQRNQFQWRVGAHWYFWRHIGVLSLIYTDEFRAARRSIPSQIDQRARTLELTAQYRF